MLDKILLLIIFEMIIGIAEPFRPVALCLVFVPFIFTVEEMIMELAVRVSAGIRLEISEDVFPGIE